uniref:Similar to SET domain and mariner transposase n=2 Tax=Haemonchus contortus TaxID=6289 RepID=A0A7I4YEV5_HAECO
MFRLMPTERQIIRDLIFEQFELGSDAVSAAENINAMGGLTTTVRTCKKWYARFGIGVTSTQDKQRSGRPVTVNRKRLKKVVRSNPFQTTRDLANALHISQSTVVRHLQKLRKKVPEPEPPKETNVEKRLPEISAILHGPETGLEEPVADFVQNEQVVAKFVHDGRVVADFVHDGRVLDQIHLL